MLRRLALATLDVVVGVPVRGLVLYGVLVTAAGLWMAHHLPTSGDA